MGERVMGRLCRRLLGISPAETLVSRRGFAVPPPDVRDRLETIGRSFLEGYHAALTDTRPEPLAARLDEVEPIFRGFAYEGAAMGLAIVDFLAPWRPRRVARFLLGAGNAHAYMVHVGIGWAAARVPWVCRRLPRLLASLDPLLRWLVVDGYGFHQGYFHWQRFVRRQEPPRGLRGYATRAFDQGLGRSLWFVEGADPARLRRSIGAFAADRQGDLWSGVGLASAYAGGVSAEVLSAVRESAGPFLPQLGQGIAFAAKTRHRAGNPAAHTAAACRAIGGISADEAAALCDRTLLDLPPGDDQRPAYESWRQRIQQRFPGGDEIRQSSPLACDV